MIQKSTFKFLENLRENNTKDWFEANSLCYLKFQSDILVFTEAILRELESYDFSILKANLDPKKCLTRINRDLRFSKDKTPYKKYVLIVFNKKGFHGNAAGYFIHIEPDNTFIGGGIWQTTPDLLKKIRKEIDYSYPEICKIISNDTFKRIYSTGIQGIGKSKKNPSGFEDTNPAIELLKMKGFCTKEKLKDESLMGENCLKLIRQYFETTKPLVDYLNRALECE